MILLKMSLIQQRVASCIDRFPLSLILLLDSPPPIRYPHPHSSSSSLYPHSLPTASIIPYLKPTRAQSSSQGAFREPPSNIKSQFYVFVSGLSSSSSNPMIGLFRHPMVVISLSSCFLKPIVIDVDSLLDASPPISSSPFFVRSACR